jgi:hypothetical protein
MKTILDIPRPVQLDGYSCGFIAAYTILKAFGIRFDKQDLREAIGLTREGSTLEGLRSGLRPYGIRFRKIRGTYTAVRQQIDAGCPVLVGSRPGVGADHWSLIIGYRDPDCLAFRNHGFVRTWFPMEQVERHLAQAEDVEDTGFFAVHCYVADPSERVVLDFPMIRQRTDWDCGVATCLMFAKYVGHPDTWTSVNAFLGAEHTAPSVALRPVGGLFSEKWKGTFPTDVWAYLAQFWRIPRRIEPEAIGRVLKSGWPVLYLCDNDGHWAWITGIRGSGWRVHCPTLGTYWTAEIEGHFWQPGPYNGSIARAYALGAKAMGEVAWAGVA